MNKKTRGFKKFFQNKRGMSLAITAFIMAAIGVVMLYVFSGMLARVTSAVDYNIGARFAAEVCTYQYDALEPWGNPETPIGNLDPTTCKVGAAINWDDSTSSSIVCDDPGNTKTVYSLTSNCSCILRIININDNSYDTEAFGICSPSGSRTDADGYGVSNPKTINGCPTCAQLCPGGPAAPPAVCGDVACGVSCESCCLTCGAAPCCQAGVCVP